MRAAGPGEQHAGAVGVVGTSVVWHCTDPGSEGRRRHCLAQGRHSALESGQRQGLRADPESVPGRRHGPDRRPRECPAPDRRDYRTGRRPGWEERFFYAEILRLKGWMLSLKGDVEGAERNFLASLDWARRQQAKMWQLRTSLSLARLWQSQGKRREAYELLAPVYNWFTEGFDTKDLLDAKALLAELG
jgi:hypothetical protein